MDTRHAQAYTLHSPQEGEAELPTLSIPTTDRCSMLIALDYDGTLHRPGSGIEPGFFAYMKTLRPYGVRWGVNTGRSLQKIAPELDRFEAMPDFICTCERYAYLAGADGRLSPAGVHNAEGHSANAKLREQTLPAWLRMLCRLRLEQPALVWNLAATDPLSIEADDDETMDAILPYLTPFADGSATLQRAGRFVRLCDARFNKGSTLRHILLQWGVSAGRLFLMGDGHNDLDAFRHFPHAFCAVPADAHPDILGWMREHGGFISPETGVMRALTFWATLHHLPTP